MSDFIGSLISSLVEYFIAIFIQGLIQRFGCRNLLLVGLAIGIIIFLLSNLARR